jgi:hypothetical protein
MLMMVQIMISLHRKSHATHASRVSWQHTSTSAFDNFKSAAPALADEGGVFDAHAVPE